MDYHKPTASIEYHKPASHGHTSTVDKPACWSCGTHKPHYVFNSSWTCRTCGCGNEVDEEKKRNYIQSCEICGSDATILSIRSTYSGDQLELCEGCEKHYEQNGELL